MSYKTTLSCFSFICSSQSEEVINRCQHSNKILLPSNVLHELITQDLFKENDILFFKVVNKQIEFGEVCSVHEFAASPGICHIPYHIMETLGLTEGEEVEIEKVSPPKGEYVKLRLHKTAFTELSNPKAILEKIMSEDYPVINQGQTIELNYKALGKVFKIDIMETQPEEIISIIDADLNVDFEAPLDYVEPPTVRRVTFAAEDEKINSPPSQFVPFSGRGHRCIDPCNSIASDFVQTAEDSSIKRNTTFVPFSGRGYRLGSK